MAKLKYPYKNDSGQKYTKQLFYEQWINMPIENRVVEPPFTLNNPKEGYICFREEYVKDSDPTGYTTAMRLLGDYTYWQYLMKVRWFVEAKKGWDEELDAKIESQALAKIQEIANSDSKSAMSAARFLAQLEYRKNGPKRGRPSNDEVEGLLKEEAKHRASVEDDAARIGLIATNQ